MIKEKNDKADEFSGIDLEQAYQSLQREPQLGGWWNIKSAKTV